MADQTSQPSASPSTPLADQLSMREAAFLAEGEGLPEAGVLEQPLPTEKVTVAVIEEVEVVEEETRRSTLAIRDPEETMKVQSYDGPIRVALEEVAVEKQQKVEEEKKKRKEKKVEEGEPTHHRKEKKNKEKKEDEEYEEAKLRKKKEKKERKERRREERCLKKEEEGCKPKNGWRIHLHEGGQEGTNTT
ncbi:protein PXR1-like [Benincasa hispida]|uniref:protein PXR1-like n=1 Tax=Benincasa hispida TaxID=102211 RepID=UPI0019028410|nr:protein PXR1-like [Benincasa hispida]